MSDSVDILPQKEVKDKVEVTKEANTLLATGKKHFLLKDFEEALSCCGQACNLLAEQYGDTAFECGDAYHLYGKVLLEVARMEAGVLGDAVAPEEGDEDSDDVEDVKEQEASTEMEDVTMKNSSEAEEKSGNSEDKDGIEVGKEGDAKNISQYDEKIGDQKIDFSAKKYVGNNEKTEANVEGKAEAIVEGKAEANLEGKAEANLEGKAEANVEGKAEANVEGKAEANVEGKAEANVEGKAEADMKMETDIGIEVKTDTVHKEKTTANNAKVRDTDESEIKSEDEKDDNLDEESQDEGDLSTLKHAWEVLEMAKIIFQRHAEDPHVSLKLADVYLHLGLIGLESETYDLAINDIMSCLDIQKKNLPGDDRLIAESYFNLGMAYALNCNISDSLDAYSKSLGILEKKIESLEKKLTEETPKEKDIIENELQELKTILPEIQEKMKELDDVKTESLKLARKLLESEFGVENGETSKTNDDEKKETKVASNISHLVRRKRKAVEGSQSNTSTEQVDEEPLPSKMLKTE